MQKRDGALVNLLAHLDSNNRRMLAILLMMKQRQQVHQSKDSDPRLSPAIMWKVELTPRIECENYIDEGRK